MKKLKNMKTVILAGGYGTRMAEFSCLMPKPLVRIGDMPILCHIIRLYAAYGVSEFIIALGYKGDRVKEYFRQSPAVQISRSDDAPDNEIKNEVVTWGKDNLIINLVDTGLNTQTGGRLKRLRKLLAHDRTFFLTYGDGLADINIMALLDFHSSHGKKATVTAVRPPEQFGRLLLEGERVTAFQEKISDGQVWINGGFFVLDTQVLDYIDGDQTVWEKKPLEKLAAEGELMAFRHHGFWHCVDTMKDKTKAEDMWLKGTAPWKVWED
ncbi:MAG: glucose-1-phosphate cytidylyltransferase [Bacillota bacterium]|jgi:glucose-1-phosphate cytidylyltransferase